MKKTIIDLVKDLEVHDSDKLLDSVAKMPIIYNTRYYWTIVPVNSSKYELFAKGANGETYHLKKVKG